MVSQTIELHTKNEMPMLALGTWELKDETANTVAYALEKGYPMIDTSGDYGTQPGIAEALKNFQREDYFIVTKVEEDEDAYESAGTQVSELGLEYADLILIHRPPKEGAGEQLWEGLIKAKQEGITRDIGVSNYTIEQMDALTEATDEMPVVNQIEWSPFGHSDRMRNYCLMNKIVIQAYSPLTRATRLDDERLAEVAQRYDKTPAQTLIRWNIDKGIVPLPKANQKEHIDENIDVFDFRINDNDIAILDNFDEHYSALGLLVYS